jgi:hypothetical protein
MHIFYLVIMIMIDSEVSEKLHVYQFSKAFLSRSSLHLFAVLVLANVWMPICIGNEIPTLTLMY